MSNKNKTKKKGFFARLFGRLGSSSQNNEAQNKICTITSHFVAPWARGHGLAKTMIEKAETVVIENGLNCVQLDVRETQNAAIQLFKSKGYAQWGTNPNYAQVKGKNIKVEDADDYIMGYTIMNDFSARKIQKEEMKLSLGPAKGKDFLTTLGPCIVSKDELSDYLVSNQDGERYNLDMQAHLNDQMLSSDNFKNITWTFAQIISHISIGAHVYPGDIIGSGTCATGCLLELNQTNNTEIWLKNSDVISLTVKGIGTLTNKIKII